MTTAALPWYPAARPALEALWRVARARLGCGPAALDWSGGAAAAPMLTQTCAPVWATRLRDTHHVVGTLDFGLAPPGLYASVLVTRIDDDRPLPRCAARVAVNDFESQSGWGALGDLPVGTALETGRHAASMAAVAAGRADLAAIDAITWRLAPHPRLRVRAATPPTPAPPILTADPALVAPLRAALAAGAAALPVALRRASGLRAVVPAGPDHYAALAALPPRPRCNQAGIAA